MDILFTPPVLRNLLLVVLFAPLGFAALVALTRDNSKTARSIAGMCAVFHLGLTLLVALPSAIMLSEFTTFKGRETHFSFRPVNVPGDSGEYSSMPESSQDHQTTWNLFFVGKPVSGSPPPAIQFFVGLDGVNVWLVLLASLMTYIAVMASWGFTSEKPGWYYAWLFVLQTAVTGAFLSFDVILFYVFFELTLIPAFFLIGGWGVGGGKRDAARKFFLYTFLGGVFSLIGLVGIVLTNPILPEKNLVAELKDLADSATIRQDLTSGPVSFNVNRLMSSVRQRAMIYDSWVRNGETQIEQKAWEKNGRTQREGWKQSRYQEQLDAAVAARDKYKSTQFWLFFALIAGFVVKIPLVPFHTWLPAAYSEAPPAVTLMLSALLAKLGTLGLLRIVIPLCPDMAVQYGLSVFGVLGAVGVVYAAFCAFAQKDIKLMAAYSSVSHLGLLALGVFALNPEGLVGGVLHMVNHGLTAGALFALVAVLYNRYRTTDMTKFGGMMATHPRFAFFTVFICLAGVGLPGLNNFVSEMMLLSALFTPWNTGVVGYGLAIAGASGIFLSAWYTFTMIRRVFFGPVKAPALAEKQSADLTGRETVAFGLLAAVILALGLYPQPVLDSIKGDVGMIAEQMKPARLRSNPTLAVLDDPSLAPPEIPKEQPQDRGGPGGPGGPPPGAPGGPAQPRR